MFRGAHAAVEAPNVKISAAPESAHVGHLVSVHVDEEAVNPLRDDNEMSSSEDAKLTHNGSGKSTADKTATTAPASVTGSMLGLKASIFLGCVYCGVGMAHTLSVRASMQRNIHYDAAAVVFMTELMKLVMSVVLGYSQDGVFTPYEVFCSPRRWSLWRESRAYAMSSFIYAVYNNLTFLNLSNFDAGTWSVFMQARIGVTGVLFTIFLKHALSVRHWASLGFLTVGITIKFLSPTLQIDYRVLFIVMQACLSALAGVYNEYVLKQHKSSSIHAQNFFMYLYALFFNVAIGVVVRPDVLRGMDFSTLVNPWVLTIIIAGALMGIAAAFILKFINSIVKIFAAAVDALTVPLFGAAFLGDALSLQDLVAVVVVVFSIVLYSTSGHGSGYFVHFHHGRVIVNTESTA